GASQTACPMVWGTDDTAAINAAITAASTYAQANDYLAEVVFGAKVYVLGAGPTQTSSPTVQNSQIVLPFPNRNGTTRKLVIMLTGPGQGWGYVQYFESPTPTVSGTALVSIPVGPTAPNSPDATFGQQSVIGGPAGGSGFTGTFANTKVVLTGLSVWNGAYTN